MTHPDAPISIVHLLAPALFGGLETVVRALASGQVERGDDVSVGLLLSPGQSEPSIAADMADCGVEVTSIRVPDRDYLGERRAVADLLRAVGAHILHTHGYRPDVVDAGVGRRLGLGTVTTVHGRTGGGWRNRVYEWLQACSFRRFDAVVAVSRKLEHELRDTGVPSGILRTLPNAWGASSGSALERQASREHLGLVGDGPVVAFVGRLSAEKGLDVFLNAARASTIEATFSVVGSGSEESRCRALADEIGVADRVRWHGAVPDAGKYLRAFDVVAITSWTEGTPMTLLEAMSAEVPVVVTAVGGVPDVVTQSEGYLLDAGDVAGLGAAFDAVLSDPTEAERRAKAARRRLDTEFAVGPWVSKYREIYRSILKER